MLVEATPLGSPPQHKRVEITAAGIEHALEALISRTAGTTPGLAVRRAISTFARLASSRGRGGEALAEVSVRYVATGAGIGVHSARAGLDLVLAVVGRLKIAPAAARDMGWELRALHGGRRGPLWLLCEEAIEALRSLHERLVATRRSVGAAPGEWRELTPEELTARGYKRCERTGDQARVICPHHADSNPSLCLFGTGATGPGYCHGCARAVHWTTAGHETWTRPAGVSLTTSGPPPRSNLPSGPGSMGPLGRCSVVPPRALGGVWPGGWLGEGAYAELAEVDAGYVSGTRSCRGFRRAWARSVIPALVWADLDGPAARRDAHTASMAVQRGADPQAVAPDRFLSTSPLRATRVELRPIPGDDPDARRALATPTAFRPYTVEWVLVDIDDLAGWSPAWGSSASVSIAQIISRDSRLSGRCVIVETSSSGVQVWAELAMVQPDPRGWWSRPDVVAWYANLSARMLIALREAGREGGHVDPTAAAPGRFGRRPGWRLEGGWVPFRSRIIALVEDRARGLESSREVRRRWRVFRARGA